MSTLKEIKKVITQLPLGNVAHDRIAYYVIDCYLTKYVHLIERAWLSKRYAHMTDNWGDAQQMEKENPETFRAPTTDELSHLQVGSIVKVCGGAERFWCGVERIERGASQNPCDWLIIARVDNHLVGGQEYDYGDLIGFYGRNVYDIHFADNRDDLMERLEHTPIGRNLNLVRTIEIFAEHGDQLEPTARRNLGLLIEQMYDDLIERMNDDELTAIDAESPPTNQEKARRLAGFLMVSVMRDINMYQEGSNENTETNDLLSREFPSDEPDS